MDNLKLSQVFVGFLKPNNGMSWDSDVYLVTTSNYLAFPIGSLYGIATH